MAIDLTAEFLTLTEASTELTLSESTIRRLVQAGKLRAISLTGEGGCVRIDRVSVDNYKLALLKEARGMAV